MKFGNVKKAKPDVPVVSMSDIAFLLIIFFMVTTAFLKDGNLKIELPEAKAREEAKSQINVAVDEKGDSYLDGDPVTAAGLKDRIASLLADAKKPEQRQVIFKCDRGVPYAKYNPVLGALAEAGATIMIIVEPGKSEQGPAPQPPPATAPKPAGDKNDAPPAKAATGPGQDLQTPATQTPKPN